MYIEAYKIADIIDILCDEGLHTNIFGFDEKTSFRINCYYVKELRNANVFLQYEKAVSRIKELFNGEHELHTVEYDYFDAEYEGQEAYEHVITIKEVL